MRKAFPARELATHAARVGLDLPADKMLLPKLIELLSQELPDGWTEERDPLTSERSYVHRARGLSQSEHPASSTHRSVLAAAKYGPSYLGMALSQVAHNDEVNALKGMPTAALERLASQ